MTLRIIINANEINTVPGFANKILLILSWKNLLIYIEIKNLVQKNKTIKREFFFFLVGRK